MSASDSSYLFNFAIWMMVGGSAIFAVNRVSNLRHLQVAAAERAALEPTAAKTSKPAADPSGDLVEIRADSAGHFRSAIDVNGRSVSALIDTGATMVALTYEDAERAGIFLHDRDFIGRTQTANGTARVAPITLERVTIGPLTLRNVQGVVAEPGALSVNLLGMSFLGRLRRFEASSGRLVLEQ